MGSCWMQCCCDAMAVVRVITTLEGLFVVCGCEKAAHKAELLAAALL
jgi:hypothetical protein